MFSIFCVCLYLFDFCLWVQASGGSSFFVSLNFTSNAVRIMSGDPLGPELGAYLEKHIFLERTCRVRPMVEKSVKNYIEWCFQNTKRLDFGQRYEDIMILSYYDLMIC